MVVADHYAYAGFAVELLANSEYHKQQHLGSYLSVEIFPAFWNNQFRFYFDEMQKPSALITWAWLSEDVEKDVHNTGRSLSMREWQCGDRIFFNDWITPYDNIREVMHDISHNVFPDVVATGLRRNMDGTVRRINRWTGVNRRRVLRGKTT